MAAATSNPRETKGCFHKVCIIQGRLDNKLAIVTGASAGIGEATTAELARRGATVIMACRNRERAEAAKRRILDRYGASNPMCMKKNVGNSTVSASLRPVRSEQLQTELLNLGDLQSVRNFADRFMLNHETLDYLINNAGTMNSTYSITVDGHERVMGVNYLGHFLLTELLLPLLKKAAPSKIIFLSSMAHRWGRLYKPNLHIPPANYNEMSSYEQSKLAVTMYAAELGRTLAPCGVIAISLHPGMVRTGTARNSSILIMKLLSPLLLPFTINSWKGAQTTMYAVLTNNLVPGAYYENCKIEQPHPLAANTVECRWLCDKSRELVGLQQR
ncbi:unnamed protein product [Calicophoron daubneyi]|uniref:Retinol dehydrogenase 12 n=1 Tax=Calicophoron daubneyi TaxID=300641 RepID=A0AAV2T256_CALDB